MRGERVSVQERERERKEEIECNRDGGGVWGGVVGVKKNPDK